MSLNGNYEVAFKGGDGCLWLATGSGTGMTWRGASSPSALCRIGGRAAGL
jgi:hypothetical protein